MVTKTTLPRDFLFHPPYEPALFIVGCYVLWLVPAVVAYSLAVVHNTGMLASVFVLASGFGYFAVAGIAHEGLHGNLATNRYASAMIGAVFSAPVMGFYAPGFFILHSQHHAYVNTQDDPVIQHYSRYRNAFSRVLLARIAEGPRFLIESLRIIWPKTELPKTLLPEAVLRAITIRLLIIKLFFLGIAVWLMLNHFTVFMFLHIFPGALTIMLASISPYLEHGGVDKKGTFECARSQSSPILTALRLGANFHLAHHCYPSVPCWRLKRLHAWMSEHHPTEVTNQTDTSLMAALRNLSVKTPYNILDK